MQQIDHSPNAYREFANTAPTDQSSPWALLQAVQHTNDSATAALPPHLDTAPWSTDFPAADAAPVAAPAEPFAPPPRVADSLPLPAVPAVPRAPERSLQGAADNPFGRLFRNASANGTEAHRENAESSLKRLLREIGSCR